MKANVRGKVRNTNLPPSRSLWPLFEAVTNSIQSIQTAGRHDGMITITVQREPELELETATHGPGRRPARGIKGVVIRDNGEGFNEANFEAFQEADTPSKINLGGRGVGRFTWLKAFDRAEVDSIFESKDARWRRRFGFELCDEGVVNPSLEPVTTGAPYAQVSLIGLKPRYAVTFPKQTDAIARRMLEHVLKYLMLPNCPRIVLEDADESPVEINTLFQEMVLSRTTRAMRVREHDLALDCCHVKADVNGRHQVHYCADDRVVRTEPLNTARVPNLEKALRDSEGREFFFEGYVTGRVLDTSVNNVRTDFLLVDERSSQGIDFPNEVSWGDVETAVTSNVTDYLKPFTETVRVAKVERIVEYIERHSPRHRPLVRFRKEALDRIPATAAGASLEVHLYRAEWELEQETRERMLEMQRKPEVPVDSNQVSEVLERTNAFNHSRLAEHVVFRKLLLDFLESRLQAGTDGRYSPEDAIHKIVFPMRATSDEVMYDQQNLWIIDEKLAYHFYLASDKPLTDLKAAAVESSDRPDIVVFNRPHAFAVGEQPFSSVVIVEFKRPERDDYRDGQDPISQVYKYIRDIRAGTAKDATGRTINIGVEVPFYCYIVADLTPNLKRTAEDKNFFPTPDALGYFSFNATMRAYVEVMTFTKLLGDARKRNRMLFQKLGLLPEDQ